MRRWRARTADHPWSSATLGLPSSSSWRQWQYYRRSSSVIFSGLFWRLISFVWFVRCLLLIIVAANVSHSLCGRRLIQGYSLWIVTWSPQHYADWHLALRYTPNHCFQTANAAPIKRHLNCSMCMFRCHWSTYYQTAQHVCNWLITDYSPHCCDLWVVLPHCLSCLLLFSDSLKCTCNYCIDGSVSQFKFPKVVLARISGEVGTLCTVF